MEKFMKKAIACAKKAFDLGEVPIGAVIVKENKVIASAYNMRENKQNALCHAEIMAIDKACKKLNNFRLDDCTLFVTLEPCPMCSGAIVQARLKRVVYGLADKQYGCAGSLYNLLNEEKFEHKVEVVSGVLESECENLMKDFFAQIRWASKLQQLLGKDVEIQNGKLNFDGAQIDVMGDDLTCGSAKLLGIIKKIKGNKIFAYVSKGENKVSCEDIWLSTRGKLSGKVKIIDTAKQKRIYDC